MSITLMCACRSSATNPIPLCFLPFLADLGGRGGEERAQGGGCPLPLSLKNAQPDGREEDDVFLSALEEGVGA